MKRQLKGAVIGCNGIAFQKTLPALSEQEEIVLEGFCDLNLQRAQQAKEKFGEKGASVYRDYKELLLDTSIDVVYVCTPNATHAQITIDALNRGKHVMCEKPMASNYQDAKRMVEAAKKSGKKLTIAFQNRFRQDAQILKQYCDQGLLGDIYYAKAHAIRRRSVPTWGVFMNKKLQGGGPLIDVAPHSIDLALWFLNNYEPKSVMGTVYKKLDYTGGAGNAFGPWNPETFEVEDSAFAIVTMQNGASLQIETSWALNIVDEKEAKTTLCGTRAGADMDDGLRINGERFGKLYVQNIETKPGKVPFFEGKSCEETGVLENKAFLKCILDDTDPIVQPEQALTVSKIIDAIYRSSETGLAVNLDTE